MNFDIEWSFCRYFWEGHVKLPEIKYGKVDRYSSKIIFIYIKCLRHMFIVLHYREDNLLHYLVKLVM